MSPELLATIINSQNVLSALAVLAFLGFGLFIDRRVWPWWVTFSQQLQTDSVALKNRALEVQERNDQRWYQTSDKIIHEMQTTAVTLAVVRRTADDVLAQIAGLREQLDDLEQVIFPNEPKCPK